MEESEISPCDDYESENFDSQENICRSRSGTIKSKELTVEELTKKKHEKRKKTRKCIAYLTLILMIAAAILVPIIVSVMKKPPTHRVSHGPTSKPVTTPLRIRTTTTTATPFDKCERKFVALTKKMGSVIISVAAADLNHDNKTDIIFIDDGSEQIFIIFNLGNDKFSDPIDYTASDKSKSALIILDFNNDGHLDIILGFTQWEIFVDIFLNNGDGTFHKTIRSTSETDGRPESLAIADLDNDGKYDFIIANVEANNIRIILSKDDSTFDGIRTYSVGDGPMSVAAADLNNDKRIDIITANAKSYDFSILFNDGNGHFADPINYSVGTGPLFVTVTDMNKDHTPDIIIVNYFSNNVVINFNNGKGNFTRQTNFSGLANPLSVALNDYNSDGFIDVIVPNYHSNNVAVFFNNKYGIFNRSTIYVTYPLPRTVTAADLNEDKKPDIIVGNGYYVGVILSRCD